MATLGRDTNRFESLATALLGVASIRFGAFCERFGRDPLPEEPLLFDPICDEPTPANASDRMLQVMSAAAAANVDAVLVLRFLGFRHIY